MVRNEGLFLPFWMRYYGRFFHPDDIWVYDNDSIDGSTDLLPANVRKLPSQHAFDVNFMRLAADRIQRELLQLYECVLFADADEYFYPLGLGLGAYIEQFRLSENQYVQACGWDVLHQKNEPAIDWGAEKLLPQRSMWYPHRNYYKPSLTKIPMPQIRDQYMSPMVDQNFYLVHAHRIDYESCKARTFFNEKLDWNPSVRKTRSGWQHRIDNEADFDKYFYQVYMPVGPLQPIRGEVRDAI